MHRTNISVGFGRVGFHRGGQKTRSAAAGKSNRGGGVAFGLSTLRSTATEVGWPGNYPERISCSQPLLELDRILDFLLRQVLAIVGDVLLVLDEFVANCLLGVPSGNSVGQTVAHDGPSVARKVDETALDVGVDQLDSKAVAHVQTLEAALEPAFRRRLEEPDPGSLRGGAGDDGVE